MKPDKIIQNPLKRISIHRIRMEMGEEVCYLSDELIIASLTPDTNHTVNQPVAINGFAAIVMMGGEARISIDTKEYDIKTRDIVFFSPESVISTLECSADATAYLISASKSFMNNIQIDLSTSLGIYMRFGRNPILHIKQSDLSEIRQLFQLIKTMLKSDKERFRNEIIRTLFTTIFYILSDLNSREHSDSVKLGRSEVIFDEFMVLLNQYNKSERNVNFYASKLNISSKYLSAVVKEVSGKSAAKWIDESVIIEAKLLLTYSGKSIQEIAEQLNFSTQSFFGKYFKQHTGISPSRYKRGGGRSVVESKK